MAYHIELVGGKKTYVLFYNRSSCSYNEGLGKFQNLTQTLTTFFVFEYKQTSIIELLNHI